MNRTDLLGNARNELIDKQHIAHCERVSLICYGEVDSVCISPNMLENTCTYRLVY